jgi:hypothetical protein
MLPRDTFSHETSHPARPAPVGGFFNFKDVVLSKRLMPTAAHALTPWAQNDYRMPWPKEKRGLGLRVQPAGLKNRHFSWVIALLVLTHLSQLMAQNDDHRIQWAPPIEPPGSVVVTSMTDKPVTPATQPTRNDTGPMVTPNISSFSTPGQTPVADEASLRQALQQWSQAWSGRTMPQYLAMYASDFQPPKGMSPSAWAQQRTQRITSKQSIRHEMRHVNIHINANQATVRFTQIYQDERLRATDAKTMHWVFRNGLWQITRETSG